MATAVGMAVSMLPPNISHAAMHRIGRIRLPPAMSEYRMDSVMVAVSGHEVTMDSPNACGVPSTRYHKIKTSISIKIKQEVK